MQISTYWNNDYNEYFLNIHKKHIRPKISYNHNITNKYSQSPLIIKFTNPKLKIDISFELLQDSQREGESKTEMLDLLVHYKIH